MKNKTAVSATSRLHIRPARASDSKAILRLIRELARYEKLSHEVVATEAAVRRSLFGRSPVCEALIAEWEGVPVGFALFFHNFSTFLSRPGIYLEDLYVQPKMRGKKIGLSLLARIAKIAAQRGCRRFEWSVLDWNRGAIRFYKKIGARPMKGWTVYRLSGDALTRLSRKSAPTLVK